MPYWPMLMLSMLWMSMFRPHSHYSRVFDTTGVVRQRQRLAAPKMP
jgi:hypothetical protein